MRPLITILIISFFTALNTYAQEIIHGAVFDYSTKQPLKGASVINTFTDMGMQTDAEGKFNIKVKAGDLVEISYEGYKTARIRIPKGELPSFFKINLREDVTELAPVTIYDDVYNHKRDSIKTAEVYKRALQHYKLEGIDILQHPFDALSKRNRQIWAFQKHYQYWENEKYIDYVFNDKLIKDLTQLSDDSIAIYKQQFRPSVAAITSFDTDYEFYEYIKYTANVFRNRNVRKPQSNPNEFRIDYNDR